MPHGPLKLAKIALLRAEYFLKSRKLGSINVGNGISVEVDGPSYTMSHKDALYIEMGAKGGLKMLTQNMVTKKAKPNIQINGIGPGYFATS